MSNYLLNMKMKGSCLKGVFDCMKMIANGHATWFFLPDGIRCSEYNSDDIEKIRSVLSYTLNSTDMITYTYHFEKEHKATFLISDIASKVSKMKVNDILRLAILKNEPSVIRGVIYGKDGQQNKFRVDTLIRQDTQIIEETNIYSDLIYNIPGKDFLALLRKCPGSQKSKTNKITIQMQGTTFFIIKKSNGEVLRIGNVKLNENEPYYERTFYTIDFKPCLKLISQTVVNIYQPCKDLERSPLKISSQIKDHGRFSFYILPHNVIVKDE